MKEKTTITLPARVDTGGAAFEDLLAEIGRRFNTEKYLKNAAFSFWSIGGCIWSSGNIYPVRKSQKEK